MAELVPIGPFTNGYNLVSNVTPFTYSDNLTYLDILEQLKERFNVLLTAVQDINTDYETIAAGDAKALADLRTYVDDQDMANTATVLADIAGLREDLLEAFAKAVIGGAVFDPANGHAAVPVAQALSDVYDYARIAAYFAYQYDALDNTAGAYDAIGYTARRWDTDPILLVKD